jgi:hypothetical protein
MVRTSARFTPVALNSRQPAYSMGGYAAVKCRAAAHTEQDYTRWLTGGLRGFALDFRENPVTLKVEDESPLPSFPPTSVLP